MNRSGASSPSPHLLVGILCFIALVRCGGTSSPSKATANSVVTDAGACLPNDKGELHRCQSPTCSVSPGGQPLPCKNDGDCELNAAGVLYQGTCVGGRDALQDAAEARVGVCRLDECFSDRDCASGTACSCLGDLGHFGDRNSCVPANCRTDGDCGPGGVCSPSISFFPCGYLSGFFCHTPRDTCATDADCSGDPSTPSCQYIDPNLARANPVDAGPSGAWTCVNPGHCPSG